LDCVKNVQIEDENIFPKENIISIPTGILLKQKLFHLHLQPGDPNRHPKLELGFKDENIFPKENIISIRTEILLKQKLFHLHSDLSLQ
jgi:hypothetical protein